MKFLADSMLGKTARWLRMLGQDVVYDVKLDDTALLALAKQEKRVLLTKDLALYKRSVARGVEACFVEGKSESQRLAEISKRYNITLSIDMEKSNCPICNTKLNAVSKEQIAGELKKNTYAYYHKFWKCPNCGQIYWQGAHWKQISNTLNAAQKLEGFKEKEVGLSKPF